MTERKSLRDRGRISYEEYSDDGFDSPVKKQRKIVSSDSDEGPEDAAPQKHGILKFARKGVDNTKLPDAGSSPPAKRKQTAASRRMKRNHKRVETDEETDAGGSEVDPIEDSSSDDQGGIRARPRRAAAAKPVAYNDPALSSSEEEAEQGARSGDDEQPIEVASGSSSEEESAKEDAGSSEDEEEAIAPRLRRTARTIRPTQRAREANARRSARVAGAAKSYNEDALEKQFYSSDDEGEDSDAEEGLAARQRELRRNRAARRAVPQKTTSSDVEEDDFDSNAENQEPGAGDGALRRSRRRAAPRQTAASRRQQRRRGQTKPKASVIFSDSDEEPRKRRQWVGSSSGSDSDSDASSDEGDEMDVDDGSDSDDAPSWIDEDNDAVAAQVERILAIRPASPGPNGTYEEHPEDSLRVKLVNRSFRAAAWVPRAALYAVGRQQLVRNFDKKARNGEVDPYGDLEDGIHPDWVVVDRIAAHKDTAKGRFLLVKWRGLGYAEATWEPESSLAEDPADQQAVQRYFKFSQEAASRELDPEDGRVGVDLSAVPQFCNGRSLRPYQLESLKWMATHWYEGTNCILGDEMGLGKTAQSIAALAFQRQFGGASGPFLVVAPLTTLGHWQREIETWTDMDCIVYAGSGADREIIQKYDLWVSAPGVGGGRGQGRRGRRVKPHVVLSSYETILRDQSLFQSIEWDSIVIDEAHRMKTVGSSTRTAIADISTQWLLLLTGTPVQNNMRELFGLLNLLDPRAYPNEETFLERFGDDRTGMTPQQVKALQQALRPVLLRRMKEDVETLPEKEECIIWVQLTVEQRAYYKAIFEGHIGTLMAGAASKNLPNLRNLAMELRKVCCHPFLCNGLEDDFAMRRAASGLAAQDDSAALTAASGKMVLLDKLLPKLRSEGHKVLIFSQFKMMLDVLEDYMKASGHPVERIDGSTASRDRQAAIDRFSNPDSDSFVFLLSTRAGGQGITLTAADTCIIYDSDWNPQNDLQAMARCHRIGQDKDVTIYRLVSKDTYEEHVFQTSSRKYGLDEAILGGIGAPGANGGDPEADGKKIADLLKHGAHCLAAMDAANKETEAFASEDIDQILNGRTEKRQIGGRAGNTFSVATFETAASAGAHGDDKAFWGALLPEALQAHEAARAAAAAPVILPPRQKKKVNYREQGGKRKHRGQSDDGDSDYDASLEEGATKSGTGTDTGKGGGGRPKGWHPALWTRDDAATLLQSVMRFGLSRPTLAVDDSGLEGRRPRDEIAAGAVAMVEMLRLAESLAPARPAPIPTFDSELKRVMTTFQRELPAPDDPFSPEAIEAAKCLNDIAQSKAKATIEKLTEENKAYEAKVAAAVAQLKDATKAACPIPEAVERVLLSDRFLEPLVRNAERNAEHLHQLEALHKMLEAKERPPFVSNPRTFPNFWTRNDDAALMRGCAVHGWEQRPVKAALIVETILNDPAFGFPTKIRQACDAESEDPAEQPAQGPVQEPSVPPPAPAPGAEEPEGDSFVVKPSAESSQPSVLQSQQAAAPPQLPAHHPLLPGGLSGPKVLPAKEWDRFKDAVARHLRKLLEKVALREKSRDPMAVEGAMPSDSEPTSSGMSNLSRAASGSMSAASGPSGGAPLAKKQSADLRKQVLNRVASKAMEGPPSGAVPAPQLPVEDPIESASEDDDFILPPKRANPAPPAPKSDKLDGHEAEECLPPGGTPVPVVAPPKPADAGGGAGANPAGATPSSAKVPALNVFDETRGGFTDPTAPGTNGGALNGKASAAAAVARSDGGPSPQPGGSGGKGQVAPGMRQRSLFEMVGVKRMKRTRDGIQGEEESGHAARAEAVEEGAPVESGEARQGQQEVEVVSLVD